MHCDTIWLMMRTENAVLHKNNLCVDIEKMKQARSLAQFFACFIYMEELKGEKRFEKGYQMALQMIKKGKSEFEKNADVIALAYNYDTLMKNKENGKMSAILTIEEGGILDGDMSRLRMLYEEGIRLVTLTWNGENCIGYPNSRDVKFMQMGLKEFGVEVVENMNNMGMIIDVSHLSDGGFWDVIKHSKKPIVASHSNARTLCNHPRNLTDDMIRAMADQGGVAGINFYPYFLNEKGNATVEHIANHVEHMYQVGGEDFIAIGTDFDGFDEGDLDIQHIGEMPLAYQVIKKRGFTERQMDKIWSGNIMRVIKSVC